MTNGAKVFVGVIPLRPSREHTGAMTENRYTYLPPQIPATELEQTVSVDEPVPVGPEADGDGD